MIKYLFCYCSRCWKRDSPRPGVYHGFRPWLWFKKWAFGSNLHRAMVDNAVIEIMNAEDKRLLDMMMDEHPPGYDYAKRAHDDAMADIDKQNERMLR